MLAGLVGWALVSLVGLIWLCAITACLGGRGSLTAGCALIGYLSVGTLLGFQVATEAETSALWRWYHDISRQKSFSVPCWRKDV